MPDIDVFFGWVAVGAAGDPPRLHPRAGRRGAADAAVARRAAVAARPLAGRARRDVQERAADALRLAARALLHRRAQPSVARPADDLFGAIALAVHRRLVPCRQPVHHRRLALDRCSPVASPGRAGARSAGSEWRRPAQAAIAIVLVYIAFNLGLSQTAPKRSSWPQRRARRRDLRLAAAGAVLAARP